MADDTRDHDQSNTSSSSNTASTTTTSSQLPKKFPKGIVLGKDGKPCRSCTSFASWASQTSKATSTPSTTPQSPSLSSQLSREPTDCPPSVETLGTSSWTLLHSLTASYPVSPTPTDRQNITQFLSLLSKLYPCWVCAEDFQVYMEKNQVRTGSREEFGRWMCEAHNNVNRKLGKQEFDCNLWEERWRTGWKDGRCG